MLPSIDKAKTKKAVEREMMLYSYYLLSVADNDQIKLDKETFVVRLDIDDKILTTKEIRKLKFIQHIIDRYNRLSLIDKKIIYYTYMNKEKINDGIIANEINFNLNYFYRIKKEAITKMAYALNAEVLEGEENETH